jgi:hypothetical protein
MPIFRNRLSYRGLGPQFVGAPVSARERTTQAITSCEEGLEEGPATREEWASCMKSVATAG